MEVEARYSLSNLPDEIVHNILSFLQVRDIARCRVLSRKLRTLCSTTPSFSYVDPRAASAGCGCLCMNCFNFMNTIPQHRPHALKIHKLSFSSHCKRDEHHSLHEEWINKLFQTFHVDELYLYYQLPSIFKSLPRFQSLKVLKLKMRGLVTVELPEMKLASLETLYVQNIHTKGSVSEWVSQSFPSLKSLFLSHVWAAKQLDLSIRSSYLEDLSIQYCCPFKVVRIITENLLAFSYAICFSRDCGHNHEMVNKDDIVVEMCAPNLQSFSWNGSPPKLCYGARTFKSLHVASITQIRYYNLDWLIQLFEAMRWTTLLHIDTHVLEDLYWKPSITFGNVRHLKIWVERNFWYHKLGLNADDYNNRGDALITFLKTIPNLETLNLVSRPLHDSEELHKEYKATKEYFKKAVGLCEQSTKWKAIKGVKKVKFTIGRMHFSMALLIGMMKTRCVDLEEMTLIYVTCYDERMKLYLNCLESASSALSINLVLNKDFLVG